MTERRTPLYRGRVGMSEREYAAHAGISRGAVQKARASGRLMLHADGSIDAAASDARRAQATDPSMQRGRHAPSLRPVPEAAVGAVSETLREQGLPAPAAAGGMAAQGVPRLDADHQGFIADRAGIRGLGPAAVLRPVSALLRDAMAQVRTAAVGQGQAGDGGLSLRGLRAADRRAPQDADAGRRRVAAGDDLGRSAVGRVSSVQPLQPVSITMSGRR